MLVELELLETWLLVRPLRRPLVAGVVSDPRRKQASSLPPASVRRCPVDDMRISRVERRVSRGQEGRGQEGRGREGRGREGRGWEGRGIAHGAAGGSQNDRNQLE